MALKGTLKDFGVADIFQLIGQQQKVGVLHLTEGEHEVHVAFKGGNVVRAESATRKRRELLGDMLLRAGIITERQLEEALEEQKRTLKRLGSILVASGAVTQPALRQMALLQTTETLYRLFAWKSGHYEFEATDVELDPESIVPIRSEGVLMEGFRRVDEWPVIRKKISSPSMTFERLKPLPSDAGAEGGDARRLGGDRPGERAGGADGIGSTEALVFRLAEAGREVQSIADRSRLGEFEACKALFNLVNRGYLKPVAPPAFSGAEAGQGSRPWIERAVLVAGQLSVALALAAAAVLSVTRMDLNVLRQVASRGEPLEDPALQRFAGRSQRSRIESALWAYAAVHGAVPEDLQELVTQGILTQADLRYPWREGYYYRKTGEVTYLLLAPLP